MLIMIQICFYMSSYQDFLNSLSTDKNYVNVCYFLGITDSVKKQIALSEKYHDDSKNIYFLMIVRNIGIFVFNVDLCFEKFRGKKNDLWLCGRNNAEDSPTTPATRPDPPAWHTGRQLFPRFFAVSQVSESDP